MHREFIQIKTTTDGNFIYCYPSTIIVDNSQIRCENNVLKISLHSKIEIDERELWTDVVKISLVKGYNSVLNHVANRKFFKTSNEFYKEIEEDLKVDEKDLKIMAKDKAEVD